MKRASDWELRVMHEAALHDTNCFITLTYSDEALPMNESLAHPHYQLFMKRLRKKHSNKTIRYYMCGEYGEANNRPHYHACIFNHDFPDRTPIGKSKSGEVFYTSKELEQLWGHGHVSVQELNHQTASYCARYIMKKQMGRNASYDLVDINTGEITERDPEYNRMSLKPHGIAEAWYAKYNKDIHTHDHAIIKGSKRSVPKYYDKLLKKRDAEQYEAIKLTRAANAAKHKTDQTPERLTVREIVHTAKLANKKRDMQ